MIENGTDQRGRTRSPVSSDTLCRDGGKGSCTKVREEG